MDKPEQREGLNAFIEHLHAKWRCSSENRIALIKKSRENWDAHITVPSCNMWSCPECSERLRRQWSHRIMKGVSHYQRKGHKFSFVTLTLRGDTRSRNRSIDAWRVLFPRIIERHRRLLGTVPYAVIPELHKNGVVHIHCIIASQLTKRWWKDTSFHAGAGHQADMKPITDHTGAVSYVVKYLGKGMGLKKWPKNYRRIRVTHDWPKDRSRDLASSAVYDIYHARDLDYVIAKLERLGYNVITGYGQKTTQL